MAAQHKAGRGWLRLELGWRQAGACCVWAQRVWGPVSKDRRSLASGATIEAIFSISVKFMQHVTSFEFKASELQQLNSLSLFLLTLTFCSYMLYLMLYNIHLKTCLFGLFEIICFRSFQIICWLFVNYLLWIIDFCRTCVPRQPRWEGRYEKFNPVHYQNHHGIKVKKEHVALPRDQPTWCPLVRKYDPNIHYAVAQLRVLDGSIPIHSKHGRLSIF